METKSNAHRDLKIHTPIKKTTPTEPEHHQTWAEGFAADGIAVGLTHEFFEFVGEGSGRNVSD